MENVMAGPHLQDIATLKPKLTLPDQYDDIKGWRIAYSIDLGYQEVDPEVRTNTLAAVERFRSLGAVVEEVELGWTAETLTAALDHLTYGLMGASLRQYDTPDQSVQLTGYVKYLIQMAKKVTIEQAYRAETVAAEMYAPLSRIFESYNLFICPTVANTGVPADFDYSRQSLTINGIEVEPKFGWVMTYPCNMLSRCPVLAIPSGRAANNVPTGIQRVGPTYEDTAVFQAAAAYEAAYPLFFSGNNFPDLAS
jgi:amidase